MRFLPISKCEEVVLNMDELILRKKMLKIASMFFAGSWLPDGKSDGVWGIPGDSLRNIALEIIKILTEEA